MHLRDSLKPFALTEHATVGELEAIVFAVVLYASTIAAFPLFLAILRTDAQLAASALLLRATDESAERQIKMARRLPRIKLLPLEQRRARLPTQPAQPTITDDLQLTGVRIATHAICDSDSLDRKVAELHEAPSLSDEKTVSLDELPVARDSATDLHLMPTLQHPYRYTSNCQDSQPQDELFVYLD